MAISRGQCPACLGFIPPDFIARGKHESGTLVFKTKLSLHFCFTFKTQPKKVKVVGTFHVPFTRNHFKFTPADGTTERACYFCRLCRATECTQLPLVLSMDEIRALLFEFLGRYEVEARLCREWSRQRSCISETRDIQDIALAPTG